MAQGYGQMFQPPRPQQFMGPLNLQGGFGQQQQGLGGLPQQFSGMFQQPQMGGGQPQGGLGGWASGLKGLMGQQDPMARARQQGLFGSPALRAALQRGAMRSADAQRRRGSVLSQLVGLSPEQQRVAMLDTERQASGQTADFLNNAQLQEQLGNQDYGRQLFGGQLDFERQKQLMKMQQDYARSQQPGAMAQLGQLAGIGIGGFAPALGAHFFAPHK